MRFGNLPSATAVLLGATVATLFGHRPAFDVASVKFNHSGGGGGEIRTPPGTLQATNSTLLAYIRWAYDMRDFQISGAPAWLNSDRYDIRAKAAAGTSGQELRLMLQDLLAERFKLQLHREAKQLPLYSLVVAKGGSKLKKAAAEPSGLSDRRGSITDRGATMGMLANQLSAVLERTVVDKTGLTEKYDFKLEWVS